MIEGSAYWSGLLSFARLLVSCHHRCMTTNTPVYDRVTQELGFSLESLGLRPLPLTKRQRHRARKAAAQRQELILAEITAENPALG